MEATIIMSNNYDELTLDDEADVFDTISSAISGTTRSTAGRLNTLSQFKQVLIVDFIENWLVNHTTFSNNSRSSYKTYVVNCFTRTPDKLSSDDRSGWKKFCVYLDELRQFND